ncbi:hypothetical protein Tco_0799111 [Tanacetum coccineum]
MGKLSLIATLARFEKWKGVFQELEKVDTSSSMSKVLNIGLGILKSTLEKTSVSYGSKSDNKTSETLSESNDFVSCDNSDKSSATSDVEDQIPLLSGGGVVDLTGDEDPTNEDGDIGVSVSLGVEIFLEGKKSQESNIGDSDNTGDGGKTAGRAIITWGGGIASLISESEGTIVECFLDIYEDKIDIDPTDEDGDIGVSVSLGVEIFLEGKKSQESNIGDSDNTGDGGKTAGRAIITWGGGIASLISESEGTIVE